MKMYKVNLTLKGIRFSKIERIKEKITPIWDFRDNWLAKHQDKTGNYSLEASSDGALDSGLDCKYLANKIAVAACKANKSICYVKVVFIPIDESAGKAFYPLA